MPDSNLQEKTFLSEANLHAAFAFVLGMNGVGFNFGVAWQCNAIILLHKKIGTKLPKKPSVSISTMEWNGFFVTLLLQFRRNYSQWLLCQSVAERTKFFFENF